MYQMSRFEKKFGKYAIPNLATVLIICYAVGYILQLVRPDMIYYLTLSPHAILKGQVWRLVTWIIVPPGQGNILLTLLMLYLYWSLGTTLEHIWGTYRFNVYMFSGIFFTILGSFVAYGLFNLIYGDVLSLTTSIVKDNLFYTGSLFFSTEYINLSIFLAMAATLPDMQVLLMFIIPIKMKWMGIVYFIIAAWNFIFTSIKLPIPVGQSFGVVELNIFLRAGILSSLLSFIIFFLVRKTTLIKNPKQMKRQIVYKREVHRGTKSSTHHKCAVCGRTEETNPELEFRYCSKCVGNYEYCQDHLFTHTHVQ